ncbi:MAG TPA: hypothetical protein VL989_02560 [Candidatus Sulfotelmatobacter sp.]|nr:hypothetical protein [Candidatus Sulfotelmatobacter sp.]
MFGQQDDGTPTSNSNSDPIASAATAPDYSSQVSQTFGNEPDAPKVEASSAPPVEDKDVLSPAGGYPKPASQQIHSNDMVISDPMPSPSTDKDASTPQTPADLTDIKQQVIGELAPLIDKLDQPPDEHFKTLMMMIQATDNQTLISAAYDAAHKIDDEKAKAQALLDILNEINYFSQPHSDS